MRGVSRSTQARRLIEAGLALRQAHRGADAASRLRLTRAELRVREALGGAVPKSVAAGFLGVSTTALERWVDAGRIPTVRRPRGREEIEAGALIDVAGEVGQLRAEGVSRGILAQALTRLEARGLPRRSLRPNEPAADLRTGFRGTTSTERLRETAELSLATTTLSRYRTGGRSDD